jgi:PEP-CTERM motif
MTIPFAVRKARLALAGALLAATAALAGPVISPHAADLGAGAYSASSTWGSETAQSVFNGGHWNSGGYGWAWVQADMGSLQTLSEVRLTIDVWPFNTTTQRVYLSDTPIGHLYNSLTPVASRSGYTQGGDLFALSFEAATGRYLQIVSMGGASWTALGDGRGRSDWVDPAAAPQASVPEPGSALLVLLALGAAAGVLRRTAPFSAGPGSRSTG